MNKSILSLYILLILTILFLGCTSTKDINSNQSESQFPTQEPPTILTETTTAMMSISTPTIKITTIPTTETSTMLTQIPTKVQTSKTTITPISTLPKDITTVYNEIPSTWETYESKYSDFKVKYPRSWTIFTGGPLKGYAGESVIVCNQRVRVTYHDIRNMVKDSDDVIWFWGYSIGEDLNSVKFDLKDNLTRLFKITDFTEYSQTPNIHGYPSTHFTYTLTHVNTNIIGDAYIVKIEQRYYVVAYIGGTVETINYNRNNILKIIHSFDPT